MKFVSYVKKKFRSDGSEADGQRYTFSYKYKAFYF